MDELWDAPNWDALIAAYAEETSIKELATINANRPMYQHMESIGALHCIGSYAAGELIGFIVIIAPVLPHYSKQVASIESFFVAAEHRPTGAGLALLHAAETKAKGIGSPGLLASAPVGGSLAKVLPALGYKHTNEVFFRGFA